MNRVEDMKALNQLLKSYVVKGIYTNNFTIPSHYKAYIEEGCLYYYVDEHGLFLYRECEDHWKLYYYMKSLVNHFDLPEDKPVAIEIPYQKEEKGILQYWREKGFEIELVRRRMTVSYVEFESRVKEKKELKEKSQEERAQEERPREQRTHNKGVQEEKRQEEKVQGNKDYKINVASIKQTEGIYQMIKKQFHPYFGCIPTLKEIEKAVEAGEMITVNQNEKLQGVLHVGRKYNTSFVLHLVVEKSMRGKGVGSDLLAEFPMLTNHREKAKIQLWVNDENISARNLYENMGLQDDGWKTLCLLNRKTF